jgi:hypothetical protein
MEKKLWRNTHNAKTRRAYERVINLCGNDDAIKNAFEKYVDCIEETFTKTDWVSVDERLPEQESRVLFCLKGGAMIAGYFFENHFYSGDSYCFKTVTHWQPLPEPPKV